MTRKHYAALSAALARAAPVHCGNAVCQACDALFMQHRRDAVAVADAIQAAKTGRGFDRAKFLIDAKAAVN